MKKAFFLGVAASFFFAFTFVLNRKMDLAGGHWSWSASLRFFFMLPMLFALVLPRGGIAPVFREAARFAIPGMPPEAARLQCIRNTSRRRHCS